MKGTYSPAPAKPDFDNELVEGGLKDGIRHHVLREAGNGGYRTRCGRRLALGHLLLMPILRKDVTCEACRLGNDADFEALARRQATAQR